MKIEIVDSNIIISNIVTEMYKYKKIKSVDKKENSSTIVDRKGPGDDDPVGGWDTE